MRTAARGRAGIVVPIAPPRLRIMLQGPKPPVHPVPPPAVNRLGRWRDTVQGKVLSDSDHIEPVTMLG
jgi:hypothetical protein